MTNSVDTVLDPGKFSKKMPIIFGKIKNSSEEVAMEIVEVDEQPDGELLMIFLILLIKI